MGVLATIDQAERVFGVYKTAIGQDVQPCCKYEDTNTNTG